MFLPFKNSTVVPISEVRSTLILAGIQAVRAQGLFGAYSESLPRGVREQIAGLAAGIWVPVVISRDTSRAIPWTRVIVVPSLRLSSFALPADERATIAAMLVPGNWGA